jgi:hypothetical protein
MSDEGELKKRITQKVDDLYDKMPKVNDHLIEGDREWHDGYEDCAEDVFELLDEAKQEFPEIVSASFSSEETIMYFITAVETWKNKWLGEAKTQPLAPQSSSKP